MAAHRLRLDTLRPYFAEVPYYLWGQINYDSEGDCKSPTDRNWKWLDLTNRETKEHLEINSQGNAWEISGENLPAARAALFLVTRCGGIWESTFPSAQLQNWDHDSGMARAFRVQLEFERPELRPFDVGHLFWGSWKWIGWFATEFTWVGRWIMHSVVTNDPRAVHLCIHWLRNGTCGDQQSQALRYALSRLVGHSFSSDKEWIEWYTKGGESQYPEPNFDQWYADLQAQVVLAESGDLEPPRN